MLARLWRRKPSHGTVVAYLALALALSTGTAYAANTIGSDDIIDDSILSQDVHNGTLVSADIHKNAINSTRVADNSLTTADIAGTDVHGNISLSGIPNGRCTQVTFLISGTTVGQSVVVSTEAAIQDGIVLYANRVASDGHVEVNACNFTGGAMTAISSFPIHVISFG
jgi:hypothetical protein